LKRASYLVAKIKKARRGEKGAGGYAFSCREKRIGGSLDVLFQEDEKKRKSAGCGVGKGKGSRLFRFKGKKPSSSSRLKS